MDINDLLAMYVGSNIKLMYKDRNCISGLLEYKDNIFYVGNVKVDLDRVYGWDLIRN